MPDGFPSPPRRRPGVVLLSLGVLTPLDGSGSQSGRDGRRISRGAQPGDILTPMWMMRAGRGGENVDDFLQKGAIGFGDPKLGKLSPTTTKEELIKLYAKMYPEEKEKSRASWAAQLFRFLGEIKVGDPVVTFDRDRRRYILGKVAGDYELWPEVIAGKPHVRRVVWEKEILRDGLSVSTRNTLGAIQTIFKIGSEAAKELLALAVPLGATPASLAQVGPVGDAAKNSEGLGEISAETFGKADEFIEDQIDALDWKQMQELVAGILRAMGYRTTVSEPGPDRGVDVFASPDGLGLEEPRIFVEVKHRTQSIGSKEIRAFVGGRKVGDKCLYISTGGFSKEAYYEAERAGVALTLVALPRLRQLVVDFYEKLDSETRALVPLRRLYWPAVSLPG